MTTTDKKMIDLVARLTHEIALELDLHYEKPDMAAFADDDSTFIAFRVALKTLREHGGLVTLLDLHVERRIEDAYLQEKGVPLPPVDEGDLPELQEEHDEEQRRMR
jgi:hypothetical protein